MYAPTGYEAGEFIEPATDSAGWPSPASGTSEINDEADETSVPMTSDLRVDPTVVHEVAALYVDAADRRDAVTAAAFAQLVTASHRLFHWITRPSQPNALRVFFTPHVRARIVTRRSSLPR